MYTRAEHHSGFLRLSFQAQHRPKCQFHSRYSGAPEKGGGVPEISESEDLEGVPSSYPRSSRRLPPGPRRPALPELPPKLPETPSQPLPSGGR